MAITRTEHLQFCKNRALEILDNGGVAGDAYASFISDMGKHPETANHPALMMGMMGMLNGYYNTPNEMRKFINGFN
jgi:hypothetical protein